MNSVIFRADGSSRIGMGHIIRCLAFANALKKLVGIKSFFLIKAFDKTVGNLLKSQSIEFNEIPVDVSTQREAVLTSEISSLYNAFMVVTDICYQNTLKDTDKLKEYHHLLSLKHFTLCLAGSTMIDFPCQMIVSPYFRVLYPELNPDDRRIILLGPSYFVFRDEIIEVSQIPRTINEQPRNMLIVVGGSDEMEFTIKIVNAIQLLSRPPLKLHIVIGPGYSEKIRLELKNLLSNYNGEYIFLNHTSNLGKAMFDCDLAITGDGLIKYETAVTGTPSIMLSRYDSEHELDRQFAQAGSTLHVGDGSLISVETLSMAINELLDNPDLRTRMSRQGKAMLDGRGIERILEKIPMGVFE
jgi:UDP-2,4-diacetamido-2,4,6-trideoxy-beta-L-altropyranose hydrolase